MNLVSVGTYLLKILWADLPLKIYSPADGKFYLQSRFNINPFTSKVLYKWFPIPIHELSLCIPSSLEY